LIRLGERERWSVRRLRSRLREWEPPWWLPILVILVLVAVCYYLLHLLPVVTTPVEG
jgi:hypothetical protein